MTQYDYDITSTPEYQQELALRRSFMTLVYGWMTAGLIMTAITALLSANLQIMREPGVAITILLAYIGVSIAVRWGVNYMNAAVLTVMYMVYAALMGVVFSGLLMYYTRTSVASTFFVTAGMFGGMSAYGMLTKKDLSGFGSLLIMAVWGLIIASIVNIFVASSGMYWLITYAGVIIFTGLAGYYTQVISRQYADNPEGSKGQQKTAVFGALMLYITFMNMFIYMLRILGTRRN